MNKLVVKPLILVDGSSYLFRAFYALPPLTNSKGEPTGAIYGVTNMLKKLLKDYAPHYIAVVFDPKGKTFRHDIYPDYKANRGEMPDELRVQIKPLFAMIQAMGLPLIIENDVEADDVIGALAKQAQTQMPVLISTSDKDMAQLVNDQITLINTMTNKTMNKDDVKEKFGVSPEQMIDYLTLVGDSIDNVPGIAKVGPKTAAKWLSEYGSLDHIIQNADKISGKVGENLRNSLAQIPLTKQLVTIKSDITLKFEPKALQPKAPDQKTLIELYQQYEFKTWLTELLSETKAVKESHYQTIFDEKAFNQALKILENADLFAFDTETTSLNEMLAEIVGVSFSVKTGEAYYVPLAHNYDHAPMQLNRGWVLNKLKPILADETKTIIGQNLKYDLNVLANYDIKIKNRMFDTMLESYVLNNSSSRHNMDALALKYLGKTTISFEDIAKTGSGQLTFDQIPVEKAAVYAAEDADITWQLHETLWPELKKDKKSKAVFEDIEMPLMPVLAKMERNGVLIDAAQLTAQSGELAKRIEALEAKAFAIADAEFNLSSPKQLIEILYDKLNLPVLSKTPKGLPSTAENVLQELALNYPLPRVILEYRSLAKLKSTYTDSLPKQINPHTGRVHTSYNQAVTATGRLSSTDPNLQNIPAKTPEGRKIRQAFIASPGNLIIAADYSQVELRIMAHLSQDAGLLKAFADGLDVHRATAAEIFGINIDDVTSLQRRNAKAINFGLIYGMSSYGLAKQLGIARNIAQQYIDMYFNRYPGIKKYMDETRNKAHEVGYVETFFGRKLKLIDINTANLQRQKAAERAAINAPMQGTAAEIIKIAMINIQKWLDKTTVKAQMIMQVHDELVFECAAADVNRVSKNVQQFMREAAQLSVPLEVAVGVGSNWDQAH